MIKVNPTNKPVGSRTTPSQPTNPGVERSEFDTLKNIIYAILTIVALGFLSLLYTAYSERRASYEELLEKVYTLQGQVNSQDYTDKKIQDLKGKNPYLK